MNWRIECLNETKWKLIFLSFANKSISAIESHTGRRSWILPLTLLDFLFIFHLPGYIIKTYVRLFHFQASAFAAAGAGGNFQLPSQPPSPGHANSFGRSDSFSNVNGEFFINFRYFSINWFCCLLGYANGISSQQSFVQSGGKSHSQGSTTFMDSNGRGRKKNKNSTKSFFCEYVHFPFLISSGGSFNHMDGKFSGNLSYAVLLCLK